MLKSGSTTFDKLPKEAAHIEFTTPSTLRFVNGGYVPVYVTHMPLWCLPESSYANVKTGQSS